MMHIQEELITVRICGFEGNDNNSNYFEVGAQLKSLKNDRRAGKDKTTGKAMRSRSELVTDWV